MASAVSPLPELMTTTEVADLLRVSDTTISRWANDGTLPSVKFGDRGSRATIRFRRADVQAFLDDRSRAGEAAS